MKFYSIPEAAVELGSTYTRVYYQIMTHKVQPIKAGRARLLTKENLNELKALLAKGAK
jgi:hypothetical protein